MRSLENIAIYALKQVMHHNCVSQDGEIENPKEFASILNAFPTHILSYNAVSIRACFMNHSMISYLGRKEGMIEIEDEYSAINHADSMTLLHRFKTFEHFHSGSRNFFSNYSTIINPSGEEDNYYDLAAPLAYNEDEKVTHYAHFMSPVNDIGLVNLYAFCDPSALTNRQTEVLAELLAGKSTSLISKELGISGKTLEKHIQAILKVTQKPHVRAIINACHEDSASMMDYS